MDGARIRLSWMVPGLASAISLAACGPSTVTPRPQSPPPPQPRAEETRSTTAPPEPATEEERLAQAYDLFFDARRSARDRRWEDAVRLVDRALGLRYEFQDFHFSAAAYRIDLYKSAGFTDSDLVLRAAKHFQWIIDHVPGSSYAERSHLGMGFAHQSLAWAAKDPKEREERVTSAFRHYRQAGEADPRSPEPFLALAEANAEFGYDLQGAMEYVAEAQKRGPADDAAVKAAMGLILLKRGSWADAASAFRDASDRDRGNPWHWYQLSFCSFKRAEQIEAASQAAAPDPKAAQRAAGQRKAAESALRRALAIDPQIRFLAGLAMRERVDAAFAARARALVEKTPQ